MYSEAGDQYRPPPSIAFVNYYMEIKEMSKHTPIIDRPHPGMVGSQKIYRFPNGYGASVIKTLTSYGLELGVVKFTSENKWQLTYETPITDDVLGHLTPETLEQALDDIAALAKAEGEK